MWKRNEPAEPQGATRTPDPAPAPAPAASTPPVATAPAPAATARTGSAVIGQSVVVKGELAGSEDLTTEGQIEGKIELQKHVLTVGQHASVRAEVFAREVIILGQVVGNIHASEKVEIRPAGRVEGDIVSPSVAIADGAHFRGSIDMQRTPAASGKGASTGQEAAKTANSEASKAPSPGQAIKVGRDRPQASA